MPDKMPDFIPPMLATLVAAPFDDPGWQFEIKWDGFRVETVVKGADVRLWTRGQRARNARIWFRVRAHEDRRPSYA